MEQEKRRTRVLHKILTAEKGSFQAGGKTSLINKSLAPLSVGNPYMDPWANPMLVKGVPRDQAQLMESTRCFKPLFTAPFTPLEQPYFPRAGGNRSTALANDVFDVIAEAEETGGAAQRFRGTGTSRFGLSTNMDNRTDDSGTIPKPPIRTSVIKTSTKTTYVLLYLVLLLLVLYYMTYTVAYYTTVVGVVSNTTIYYTLTNRLHKMTLKVRRNEETATISLHSRGRPDDASVAHSHSSVNEDLDSSDDES